MCLAGNGFLVLYAGAFAGRTRELLTLEQLQKRADAFAVCRVKVGTHCDLQALSSWLPKCGPVPLVRGCTRAQEEAGTHTLYNHKHYFQFTFNMSGQQTNSVNGICRRHTSLAKGSRQWVISDGQQTVGKWEVFAMACVNGGVLFHSRVSVKGMECPPPETQTPFWGSGLLSESVCEANIVLLWGFARLT